VGPGTGLQKCGKRRPQRDSIPGPSLDVKFVNISQKITKYFDITVKFPPTLAPDVQSIIIEISEARRLIIGVA